MVCGGGRVVDAADSQNHPSPSFNIHAQNKYYPLHPNPQKEESTMQRHLIQSDPEIMMGKPVIAGTRITVELILEKLAAGESIKRIIEEHPRISEERIRAALAFASAALRADVVYPIAIQKPSKTIFHHLYQKYIPPLFNLT